MTHNPDRVLDAHSKVLGNIRTVEALPFCPFFFRRNTPNLSSASYPSHSSYLRTGGMPFRSPAACLLQYLLDAFSAVICATDTSHLASSAHNGLQYDTKVHMLITF